MPRPLNKDSTLGVLCQDTIWVATPTKLPRLLVNNSYRMYTLSFSTHLLTETIMKKPVQLQDTASSKLIHDHGLLTDKSYPRKFYSYPVPYVTCDVYFQQKTIPRGKGTYNFSQSTVTLSRGRTAAHPWLQEPCTC